MPLNVPDPTGKYATEYYTCKKCNYYPIPRVVKLTRTGVEYLKGAVACPRCSSSDLQFEKAYRSDAYGNILE